MDWPWQGEHCPVGGACLSGSARSLDEGQGGPRGEREEPWAEPPGPHAFALRNPATEDMGNNKII